MERKTVDPEDLFCQSIASELRQFAPKDRYMIKHEINEVLFKYQMAKFTQSPLCSSGLSYPRTSFTPIQHNYLHNSREVFSPIIPQAIVQKETLMTTLI